jgi:hypothetical protein
MDNTRSYAVAMYLVYGRPRGLSLNAVDVVHDVCVCLVAMSSS